MQEIQKVAILGAGAMGSYFASRFFNTGFSTILITKGPRLDKLKAKGLLSSLLWVDWESVMIWDHPPAQ